ncbi:hypothetical protein P8S55_09800 [Halomonas sp. M1]|uniref:hypothetical protein n=1 Tax=Halomonas sp. M1 TaxID=3035470 RepID=UPI00248580F2|nr:hypothetical protein [Halomonas sp. M1]WFE70084.1 hypothetical protein P8S55_09800 [Halomonas sp. M1]
MKRPHLSTAEWDFWYDDQHAAKNLPSRDGRDYQTRMSRIAMWTTVMDEHNYLVKRWNDFMSA